MLQLFVPAMLVLTYGRVLLGNKTKADDQGEWALATKKKRQPHSRGYSNGPGGYPNGSRGMDDRRFGRGGMGDKMRGVSLWISFL